MDDFDLNLSMGIHLQSGSAKSVLTGRASFCHYNFEQCVILHSNKLYTSSSA